ncbi:MAG: PIN domain-containing protein [Nodosilinea sp.]
MTVTSESCFLDSNIWLYALLKERQPSLEEVQKTIVTTRLIDAPGVVVSIQVINEVSTNLIKKAHFSESQIQSLIQSFYNGCQVIVADQALLTLASETRSRYSISFWDGLIVAAALTSNVPTLYSEEMQDGLKVFDQLTITNPFL